MGKDKSSSRQSTALGLAAFVSAGLWAWFSYEALKEAHGLGVALDTALSPFRDSSEPTPRQSLLFLSLIAGGFHASFFALCLRLLVAVKMSRGGRLALSVPLAFALFLAVDRVLSLVSPRFLPWLSEGTPDIAWQWIAIVTVLTSMFPLSELIAGKKGPYGRLLWCVGCTGAFSIICCGVVLALADDRISLDQLMLNVAALWVPISPFVVPWTLFRPRN